MAESSDLRVVAESLAAAGAPAAEQAVAWIAVAESEPIFRYRSAPASSALDRAALLLPIEGRPELDARAALRRAELELALENTDSARTLADVATVAAERHGDVLLALLARVISARAENRRPDGTSAQAELEALAEQIDAAEQPPGDDLRGDKLAAQLSIALGEHHLSSLELEDARRAFGDAEVALRGVARNALLDEQFLALQGSALTAQLERAFGRAADRLRAVLRLTNAHVAQREELEARMALGHMLTQLGKHDEAMRHMDLARALAREVGGTDDKLLATQSAALAAMHAKNHGRALDRAYEALALAGHEKRDIMAYIGVISLIAEIHLSRQNPSEAYLALLYASSALRQRFGARASILVDIQIEELRRSMGNEKFEEMAAAILRAREAKKRLDQG